jgi:hypothetical protein
MKTPYCLVAHILYCCRLVFCSFPGAGLSSFSVALNSYRRPFLTPSRQQNQSVIRNTSTHSTVAVTKLHASRPRKNFTPLTARLLSQQYSVASFAALRVLSCLHSPGLRCSCCNVVRCCCDLQSFNLVTATIEANRLTNRI